MNGGWALIIIGQEGIGAGTWYRGCYSAESWSKWRQQGKMAATICQIFWHHFGTGRKWPKVVHLSYTVQSVSCHVIQNHIQNVGYLNVKCKSSVNKPLEQMCEAYHLCHVQLPFLAWLDTEDLTPGVSAIEPEEGPRWKTPERRLVWRRMRLLPGCRTATLSLDLLVEEEPVDEADLRNKGEARSILKKCPWGTMWIPASWSLQRGFWKHLKLCTQKGFLSVLRNHVPVSQDNP